MRKRSLKGMLAAFLAVLMVVSSLSPLTAGVSAAELTGDVLFSTADVSLAGTYTFDAADLEIASLWGASVNTDDGNYTVSFGGQYDQLFFKLPEGITGDRIQSVSVDTDAANFSVKFCSDQDSFKELAVVYGSNSISTANLKAGESMSDVKVIGLMNLLDGEAVKTIKGITFVLSAKTEETPSEETPSEETPSEETPSEGVLAAGSYTFKPAELNVLARWGTADAEEDGAYTVSFEKQYSQIFYAIPEKIDPARIEAVSVDADAANFSVKLCKNTGDFAEVGVVYGNNRITLANLSGDVADAEVVALMNLLDGSAVKTVKSITFTIGDVVEIDPNAPVKGDLTADCFKTDGNSNPIVTQRYSADPGVMVYGDTVYVYSTNDIYEYAGSKLKENSYSKITTINCYSSKDLVNWTDHGAIAVAGKQNPEGAAKWANNSWAPCAAHKTINGQEKFFLYFADNGSGIGVLTADSPEGPFVDPIGKQLVSRQTPTCSTVEWLFDPAVLVDDDGTGYLYFGGGVPAGKAADPGTARVVKLGDDMISLAGDPVQINPPYLFEDSGINKIGDKYFYTYCSNWNCADGFRSGTIQSMVSDNPMGPFTYQGEVFANPSSFFNDGNGNNHHSFFEFNGKYYLAYHARALEVKAVGSALGYRTTQIDEVTVTDGKIDTVKGTMKGANQTTTLNPYEVQSAATIYREKGIEVFGSGNPAITVTEGDFTGVKGVSFGAGVSAISMTVKASEAMTIDVLAGSENGTKLGTVEVAATNGEYATFKAELANVAGVIDLYFVFNGAAEVMSWKADANVYTLDDLQPAGGYGFATVKDAAGKIIGISYENQYQEARFAIPEEILNAGLEKIEVVTDDASNLSIKTLDTAGNQIEVSYGSTELAVTKTEGVALIALMNKTEGAQTINISGIKFKTADIEVPVVPTNPSEEEKPSVNKGTEVVIDGSEADIYYRWNSSNKAEGGVMSFPSNYYEYCVALPEELNAEDIESITVNVAEQGGSLAIKVYNTTATGDSSLDETTPCEFGKSGAESYSVNVPAEGVVAALGFMSHADDAPFTVTLKSIVIKTKGPKAIVLTSEDLTGLSNPWNGSDIQGPSLNFNSRYQEYQYIFEDAISTDIIESVILKVKDQGGNICLKFYDSANTEWFHNYGVDGNTEYTFVPEEGQEINKIGFMSMLDPDVEGNYPYGVTLESVTINFKNGSSAPAKQEEVLEFTGDALKFIHRSDDAEEVGNVISFSQKWDEYYLDLGKELEMAERCKSFVIKVKDQNGTVSYKLYDKDDKEVQAFYEKRGNTTLAPTCDTATRFAVMAHDDNAEYPFTITIESVKIVMDTSEHEVVEKGVEYDIVNLRDAVANTMGDDFIIGTALSYDEFGDANDIALAEKHFNAITLGNELKPDSILGGSANGVHEVTLNGQTFDFPTLSYRNPESRLDLILDWNEKNPNKQIKVRGHVLVWHSQMPTWFFREGYTSNGARVSKELMNLRLEYYIKSVCEHFTAEDSKYHGLFYGWDVVNEAVSDGGGYRKDFNGSATDWWAIYKSQEFICNAFVYANRYMDPAVELYYNDYNDSMAGKIGSIEQLLRDVKATEGARIDGFGMQGHYDLGSPTVEQFMDAARRYAAIVGKVQLTELDFKGSTSSTDERLAKRYEDIYNAVRRLRDDGIDFTGMTIWGVTDKHSWLQSQNNVGGGSTTNSKQYPLLFDNNYKAKNAFWAIVNAGELMPEIKTVTLVKSVDDSFTAGKEHTIKMGDKLATFIPEWREGEINVKVMVPDLTKDETDSVTLYVFDGNGTTKVTGFRVPFAETENGYEVNLAVSADTEAIRRNNIKLDITVTDGEATYAFNDTRLKQEESTDYYAVTVAKAAEVVTKGTAVVDGEADEAWNNAAELYLAINTGAKAEAAAKLLWDEENLYVLVNVKDTELDASASQAHEQDSIEIFIDENNAKTGSYEEDDKQYRVNYLNAQSFNGTKCVAENITSAVKLTEDGYVLEAAIKWTDITAAAGLSVGFDVQLNDAAGGSRIGTLNWADATGNGWSSTAGLGTIVLIEKTEEGTDTPDPIVTPEPIIIVIPTVTPEPEEVVDIDTPETPEGAEFVVTEDMMNQIKVTPSKKRLYLEGPCRNRRLTVTLPEELKAAVDAGLVDCTLSFKSEDKSIVRVSKKGLMTSVSLGVTKVIVTVTVGDEVKTFAIPVGVREPEIRLYDYTKTMVPGEKFRISAKARGLVEAATLKYSTSDKSVVKVSKSGVLTAVAPGKAKITVKAGKLVKTFTVTVK